jgi:cell division protein FtsL
MAQIKEILSRIRLTYRRTSNLTKIVVTVAILLCMATLISLRLSTNALIHRTEDLRQKAGVLEEDNRDLEENISDLGTNKSVVEIAEEELGMVQPGAIAIEDAQP